MRPFCIEEFLYLRDTPPSADQLVHLNNAAASMGRVGVQSCSFPARSRARAHVPCTICGYVLCAFFSSKSIWKLEGHKPEFGAKQLRQRIESTVQLTRCSWGSFDMRRDLWVHESLQQSLVQSRRSGLWRSLLASGTAAAAGLEDSFFDRFFSSFKACFLFLKAELLQHCIAKPTSFPAPHSQGPTAPAKISLVLTGQTSGTTTSTSCQLPDLAQGTAIAQPLKESRLRGSKGFRIRAPEGK